MTGLNFLQIALGRSAMEMYITRRCLNCQFGFIDMVMLNVLLLNIFNFFFKQNFENIRKVNLSEYISFKNPRKTLEFQIIFVKQSAIHLKLYFYKSYFFKSYLK